MGKNRSLRRLLRGEFVLLTMLAACDADAPSDPSSGPSSDSSGAPESTTGGAESEPTPTAPATPSGGSASEPGSSEGSPPTAGTSGDDDPVDPDGSGDETAGSGGGPCGAPPDGPALWFDPSEGVTVEDGHVVEWLDREGGVRARPAGNGSLGGDGNRGRTSDEPTSRRPRLVPDGRRGWPVVRFDGNDDQLTFDYPVNGAEQMTIGAVSSTTKFWIGNQDNETAGSGTCNNIVIWDQVDRPSFGIVLLASVQTQIAWRFGTGAELGDNKFQTKHRWYRPSPIGEDWSAAISMLDRRDRRLYIGGEVVDEHRAPEGQGFAVGRTVDWAWMGRGRWNYCNWGGDLAELVIYDRALDDDERGQLDEYFRCKYEPDHG